MKTRNRWGVGPRMFGMSLVFGAPAIAAHCVYYPFFVIDAVPKWCFQVPGGVLLASGAVWWFLSVRANKQAFVRKTLLTDGMYSLCRHPLYAGWILLLVPGTVLLTRSSILLVYPFVLYACFRFAVRSEERTLEEEFGQAYREYRRRVNLLFPTFRRSDGDDTAEK